MKVLVKNDFEKGYQRFEFLSRYIQENYDTNYPCEEIYGFQEMVLRILQIFALDQNYNGVY
jgi:hypothetical protein